MQVVKIGRWVLKTDQQETRAAYERISVGSPEQCGCEDCLNFIAVREKAYPDAALAIFSQLGIDSRKEAEIWHTHRDESDSHH